MELVTGVFGPCDNVGKRSGRSGISLRQKIRAFMLAADMPDRGDVGLRKGEVPNRAEPGAAESGHEAVGMRPSVKRKAEGVGGENAVHFRKSGYQPGIISVVADSAPVA